MRDKLLDQFKVKTWVFKAWMMSVSKYGSKKKKYVLR